MADQRITSDELMVGSGHGSLSDTLNRLAIVEHGLDGTHSKPLTNWPSFSVHKDGTNQTGLVSGVATKVTWSTEEFDTNNNFTSDRFTPTVAGKYLLTAHIRYASTVDQSALVVAVHKNGVEHRVANTYTSGTSNIGSGATILVDANGTGDYFEIFATQTTGSNKDILGVAVSTWFQGSRIG